MDVSTVTADAPSEAIPAFTPGAVGLTVVGAPSREAWLALGHHLRRAAGSVAWCVGDWLRYGERAWAIGYPEASALTGLDNITLRNARWVCGRFPLSRRRDELTFNHHLEVAALPPELADPLLERAELEGLSIRDLRAIVQAMRATPAEPSEPESAVALASAVKLAASLRDAIDALLASDFGTHLRRHLLAQHADVSAVIAALQALTAESAMGFPDAECEGEEPVGAPLNRLWGAA